MSDKKKILLVDDDPDVRETVSLILEDEYEIRTAENGEQGLKFIETEKPDLVILDVMMNHMGEGFYVAKEIKEKHGLKDLPIIMLTSVNEHYDYRTQVNENYFPKDAWIDKPVKAEELKSTIKKFLY